MRAQRREKRPVPPSSQAGSLRLRLVAGLLLLLLGVTGQALATQTSLLDRRSAEEVRLFGSIPWLSRLTEGATTDRNWEKIFPSVTSPADAEIILVASPFSPRQFFSGGRFRGEWADDFSRDQWIGGHLLLNTRSYLAIDSEFNHRRREVRGDRNELWTGDANLVYWMPDVQRIAMRGGAGAAWLHDRGQTDVGWNLTYGAEVFIKRPWLLAGEVDWGRIGSDKLFHGQLTIGLRVSRFELYAGYDYFDVGPLEMDGLIGGAGLWF